MGTPKSEERRDCSATKGKDVKGKQSQESEGEWIWINKKKLFEVI